MTRISQQEIEQLVDQLGACLVLFARQWCSCPDDALQEALIELVKKDPMPRSPKAWLFRVVRSKAMNLARSQRRRAHREAKVAARDIWFEADVQSRIEAQDVTEWIERLPDIQRQVVTARIWGELTFEQVAEVVDRPTATVFRLFQEAINALRKELNPSTEDRPDQRGKKETSQ